MSKETIRCDIKKMILENWPETLSSYCIFLNVKTKYIIRHMPKLLLLNLVDGKADKCACLGYYGCTGP